MPSHTSSVSSEPESVTSTAEAAEQDFSAASLKAIRDLEKRINARLELFEMKIDVFTLLILKSENCLQTQKEKVNTWI